LNASAQAADFTRAMKGDLPAGAFDALNAKIAELVETKPAQATRQSSGAALDELFAAIPELVGGSADLTGSNNTFHAGSRSVSHADMGGNYLHYGVREFAMSAIMNGLALHGGFIPYGGTFLVFSDYARNAVRMAALMGIGSIFVYSHDSIGLGEDGPTHQPIEHANALRAIPRLDVWRPCDAAETAVAWVVAVERRDGPSCLLLTRQGLPQQPRDAATLDNVRRGGYVLVDCAGTPEAILIATGSEVALAAGVIATLNAEGRRLRLVSMPCAEVFARQDAAWREAVLPNAVRARVVIEAGGRDFWYRYAGLDGLVIGIDGFGASGAGDALFEHYGFTAAKCLAAVRAYLAGNP